MKITCSGGRVINILRANYGRFNLDVCNEDQPIEGWSDHCMSTRSLKIVLELYVTFVYSAVCTKCCKTSAMFLFICSENFSWVIQNYETLSTCLSNIAHFDKNVLEQKPKCLVSVLQPPCDFDLTVTYLFHCWIWRVAVEQVVIFFLNTNSNVTYEAKFGWLILTSYSFPLTGILLMYIYTFVSL